jgi:hypothetical protein
MVMGALTLAVPLSTRLTVAVDTEAARATSRIDAASTLELVLVGCVVKPSGYHLGCSCKRLHHGGIEMSLVRIGLCGLASLAIHTFALADDPDVVAPPGISRPPFEFSDRDAAFLDQVQHGAFKYFWTVCDPVTGMALDRSGRTTISIAGVGFQLAALPIGVERGWVSRDEAEARVKLILTSLRDNPDNRKAGLFYHFLAQGTAGPDPDAYETVVSTIDSALFFAGATVASSYFGGEVGTLADALLAEADWTFFASTNADHTKGYINLAWKPDDVEMPSGEGEFTPYFWLDAACEQRLVTFMAVAAPTPSHAIPPDRYYALRRRLGEYGDGPFVWLPWSGAMFTSVMSHCFIDYAHLEPDDPGAFGVPRRVRVDWWENSRRVVNMHRAKAIENPLGVPNLSDVAWGLNASVTRDAYAVPGLFPRPIEQEGTPEIDFPTHQPDDNWGDGTLAPYSPGSAIMFEPEAAIASMRHFAGLSTPDGEPLAWRDPDSGGCGFVDACHPALGWASDEYLAIDQGQLLLAIENARTGLVWDLFKSHPVISKAMSNLHLDPLDDDKTRIQD